MYRRFYSVGWKIASAAQLKFLNPIDKSINF